MLAAAKEWIIGVPYVEASGAGRAAPAACGATGGGVQADDAGRAAPAACGASGRWRAGRRPNGAALAARAGKRAAARRPAAERRSSGSARGGGGKWRAASAHDFAAGKEIVHGGREKKQSLLETSPNTLLCSYCTLQLRTPARVRI
ncbi:hypothetical protein ACP4OV_031648 [Aristida adscensionis]